LLSTLANGILREGNRLTQNFAQAHRRWSQCKLWLDPLAFWTPKMTAEHQLSTSAENRLDRWYRHPDSAIVRDVSVIVLWNVEVHSHQNHSIANIDISDRFLSHL
jgi:hypothetical protein